MADWRDTIGETIRAASAKGLSATGLARLAMTEVADGTAGAAGVKSAFGHAFGIPLTVSRAIGHWQEFGPGPNALSDEEFELILAPWIAKGRGDVSEPDWQGTVVQALRDGRSDGLDTTELARLARAHLGPGFSPASFQAAFFHAFEVPVPILREALRWRGMHDGSDSISDVEFAELLMPWI